MKICSIDGCGKTHEAKGYCRSHYRRLWLYGDPLSGGTSSGEPMKFVREVALKYQDDDCLIWPYSQDSSGYGRLRVGVKMFAASRYVCMIAHGDPPAPKLEAAHECGNRICVNPNHLSWKTQQGNMDDMVAHGRSVRGEKNWNTKITEAQAREILRLKGSMPASDLAARLGVSQRIVESIHAGRSWAWLDRGPKVARLAALASSRSSAEGGKE